MQKSIMFTVPFLMIALIFSNVEAASFKGTTDSDKEELRVMLSEFLEGASVNDRATHERFWADDLIYTSSAGERFGKSEIMAGLAPINQEQEPTTTKYSAEEVQIKLLGETAIVAFQLVAEISDMDGVIDVMSFYNTGTFVKRDGEWRAVAWQATRIE